MELKSLSISSNHESTNFLMKKRKRDYSINNIEILNEDNKIKILEKLCMLKEKIFDKELQEKHKNLISFLQSKNIGDKLDKTKINVFSDLDNMSEIYILDKNDQGYILSYLDDIKKALLIYIDPKLVGKLFNSNVNVEICYTNNQFLMAIPKKDEFDYEEYAINYDKNPKFLIKDNVGCFSEILYIVYNKVDFNLDSVNKENVFNKCEFISQKENPKSINLGYFYYFDILPNYQAHYFFIKSPQRIKLKNNLDNFILSSNKNVYYLTGPRGIGKTASLIYFSSLNIFHVFYINFQALFKQKISNSKKILKYEIKRFFSSDYDPENIDIKQIIDWIDNLDVQKLRKFLNNIIQSFLNFYGTKVEKIIIIDQYSEEIVGFDLNIFLKNNNLNKNFKIIISSSLGNDFTQEGIENIIDNSKSGENNMHFYSNFLNNSELLLDNEKNEKIKNELEKYGQIPVYYYLLKDENKKKIELTNEDIVNDIKFYINNDLSIIMELLIFIKNNFIFESNNIKKYLCTFYLKYISINQKHIYFELEPKTNKYKYFTDKENKREIKTSKLYDKFLEYYIQNEDEELNYKIQSNYVFDELNAEILEKEFNPKKKLKEKIYKKYYEEICNYNIYKERKKKGYITIYKLNFLFPYMEILFYKIIYDYITHSMKNLDNLINLSSEGGIFEILVIYNIISNQKFFEISVPNFIRVKSLVPPNYSIKFFSYRQKEKLFKKGYKNKNDYILSSLIGEKNPEKINLENVAFLILQQYSNGKYYDIGILIPSEQNNNEFKSKKKFKLILLQISIKKDKAKWLTNSEHEINFFFVKNNLENTYNIEIIEGYFFYILKKENNDIIDIKTYNANKEKCIFYDLKKGFTKNIELYNSHSFITKKFLIFNSSSLLKKINNLDSLEKINRMIQNDYTNLSDELFELIKNYIKNENEKIEITKEQFHIIGKEDMTNSVKSLTSFFIFIKKKTNSFIIYLNGENKEVNKIIEGNICIVSNYETELIN